MKPDPALPAPPSAEAMAQLHSAAAEACALLKAMANETRLLLLCQLIGGERNVGELQALSGIAQPSLSQQLGVLRDEGLLATRREGKFIYYSLASAEVVTVMQALYGIFCAKPPNTKKASARKSAASTR
ncbi:metalloregulator ArsR/SmtB family transcription factor [Variovorax guangxiensis]|uniref:metalloregulator ArsR/SmtB family transcription factor n=1 Tax=Variovorax guangxiensis TaxID=1775474 RepID=UPI00285E57DA|nr:metalloregulator ArsR/SmtB family transcription factor [Variovorax guangxiensis]MDR6857316.1 ArsR family transcriptional regulator [Variovorax guangxiensis]